MRKVGPVARGQRGGGKEADAAFSQFLAVAFDVQVAGHWAVGDDQVQALNRQVGKQALQLVFAATDAQWVAHFHGGGNQPVNDGLRHHIRDANPKQDLLFFWLCTQQGLKFAADLEHGLGITQGLATGFGQFQLTAHAAKQLYPIGLFQQADLSADGLRGQVQLLAGAHNAAGFGHDPEVVQLPVVEHEGSHFVKTEV